MTRFPRSVLLLGSGELGKEVAIAAQRLGCRVIACDRYRDAPAMQVADVAEVLPMTEATDLLAVVRKHRPDVVIPEIEALAVQALAELEQDGITVIRGDDAHGSDNSEDSDADEASCLSNNRAAADEHPGPAKAPHPEAKGAGNRGRKADRAGGNSRPTDTGGGRYGALLRSLFSLCHRNERTSILLVRIMVGAWMLVIALILLDVGQHRITPASYKVLGKGADSRLAEEDRLQEEAAAALGRVAGVAPPPPLWPQA